MQQWIAIKSEIVTLLSLGRDALHVYAGVGVQIVAAIILRRPIAHFAPWVVVLIVEMLNEAITGFADGLFEQWEIDGAIHDLCNVMALPTALMLLARLAPGLFSRPRFHIVQQSVQMLEYRHDRRAIEDAEFTDVEDETRG